MSTNAKRLLSQLNKLHASPLEDIALLPSDNPFEIHAILFGPSGTPYENGAFKMKLVYGSDYPAAPPKGYFLTKVYHPNVSLKGDICVNTLKRDWTAEVTVGHILMIVKCLLINPGPDSALNEEAGRQLMDSYDEFSKIAKMWTSVHAVKVERALGELEPEQRKALQLSYGDSLTGVNHGILGSSDVNKPGTHGSDEGESGQLLKKVKVVDTATKKKADAKKKAIKRL